MIISRGKRGSVCRLFALAFWGVGALGCTESASRPDAATMLPEGGANGRDVRGSDAAKDGLDARVSDAVANGTDADVSDAGSNPTDGASTWPGSVQEPHKIDTVENNRVRSLAIVGLPDHVLVAYVQGEDRPDETVLSLYLRRLRWDGSPLDDAPRKAAETSLAPQPRLPSGHVVAATDGTKTLVCWQVREGVSCFAVTDGLTIAPGPATAGSTPAVAFGPKGWGLARVVPEGTTSGGSVAVLSRLDEHGALDEGARFSRAVAADADYFEEGPRVIATEGGFAFVAPAPPPTVLLDRLDGALVPVGPPIALGHSSWGWLSMASRGDRIAVSVAKPYGASVLLIDGSGALATTEHMGGGKTGVFVAILPGGSSFEAAWGDDLSRPRCCATLDQGHALPDVLTEVSFSPTIAWATQGGRVLAVSTGAGLEAWVFR